MSLSQESLELELLVFFKKSLIKYINIEHHPGFQKQFMQNSAYSTEKIHQALINLLENNYLVRLGNLYSLTDKGSDKSCEGIPDNT
ncbi:MAG: hypothetical protein K0Q57_617 [Gammaproteobacteria bacterium]|jgi:hypothetical protein|nr:hypothetical protein [Gammaproteobacteria bacterium]